MFTENIRNFILYDGDCGFCNKIILFIAKKDKQDKFRFISNSSNLGKSILQKYGLNTIAEETIIFIQNDKYFIKSIAIKKILRELYSSKILALLLFSIPNFIVNRIYIYIAKNRNKFYKNRKCTIQNINIKHKFLC